MFYLANDSGDVSRFFALDRRTGATVATVTVAGARNVDWEDLAAGPDASGRPSVWLADIGDNDARRREVRVYRVAGPRLATADRGRSLTVPVDGVWRLRYPGGPVDAEAFAVAPDGSGYVVTKSVAHSAVYRLPARPDPARVQTLTRVGAIAFLPTGTPNPFGIAGSLTATSAAIAPDGSAFVVRTYSDAYVWALGAGGVRAALPARPAVVPLPRQPQGEGVTVAGHRLVIDSEGGHSAVYTVPLPALPRPAPSPSRTAAAAPAPALTARRVSTSAGGSPGWSLALGTAATVLVLGALVVVLLRRRR